MKIIRFLLLFLIEKTLGTLQYDSGYSNLWSYATIPADTTQEQTITFSQQFSRVPQVSLNPIIVSDSFENKVHSGYQISISSTTTLNFKVTLYIPSLTNAFSFLTFNWIAIDDTRITILQNFNEVNPQTKTISHNNSRANAGIIFFTSFHGFTKLDFTINLGTITTTTVEVNIVQSNMISLGYIVILGPREFFDIEAQIVQLPKNQYDPDVYYSKTVAKVPNRVWLFFLQYFTFDLNQTFRLQLKPVDENSEQISPSYKFCSWVQSQDSFSQCAHQCATLKFFEKTMLFQKVRISGLILRAPSNIFEFSIQDINFTYIPVITNYQILVPKTVQSITFMVKVKCNQNFKITASFYQCSSCSRNYKTIIRQCYHSEITLQFYATYTIEDTNQEQQLLINMIPKQLQIQQTDQIIAQFDLM